MNWIGGARARARAQDQLNRSRRNLPSRPRTQNPLVDPEDRDDDESVNQNDDDVDAHADPTLNQALIIPANRQSRKRRRDDDDPANDWKKGVDYVSLGYKLVGKGPEHRRVVPLLEFAEKTFPKFGHILSLQLSHQMEIQRTPTTPAPDPDYQSQTTTTSYGDHNMGNPNRTVSSSSVGVSSD